jgi:hypothetical protein
MCFRWSRIDGASDMSESKSGFVLVTYCPYCRISDDPIIAAYRREASRPKDPEAWNRYAVSEDQTVNECRFKHVTKLVHL